MIRTEAEEWIDITGQTWEEYTEPVRKMYEENELTEYYDRDCIWRDDFNRRVGPEGRRNWAGVTEFYSDQEGIFSRLIAHEQGNPADGDIILKKVKQGREQLDLLALRTAHLEAAERFGTSGIIMLDHGTGPCSLGLAIADIYPKSRVVLYDFCLPHRRVIERRMWPSMRNRVSFSWAPRSNAFFQMGMHFNLVYSQEVLEHCIDPFGELHAIHDNMVEGGVLFLSTFFNDVEGKNPSHLREHHKYQDTPTYLKAIEDCGFRLIGRDENGCERVFERL